MPIKDSKKRLAYSKEYNKKYVRVTRNKPSLVNSVMAKKEFICFDGESENDVYTLLGNSEDFIYNKDGLGTKEVLDFLYFQGTGKTKIVFSMHFDVQHWIRDLTDKEILAFLDGEKIIFGKYTISYITKRFMSIERKGGKVYIYDIFSFFQCGLLKTIDNMKVELTPHEKKFLERGKSLRGENFKGMKLKDVIEYNRIECVVTEKIAKKLQGILFKTQITYNGKLFSLLPTRFYGSGAIAKKILHIAGIEAHRDRESELPEKIKKYIYRSYYGGRAECFRIGTFDIMYKYDINSAYPYAMSQLKTFESFKIKRIGKYVSNYEYVDGNIYFVEYDFTSANNKLIGIVPHRRKDGYVMFPQRGKGYYFGIECKYFNEIQKLSGGFVYIMSVLEVKYSNQFLFEKGFIEHVYTRRLELKRQGDFSQIAYKLALNSLYGKLAQQVGQRQFTCVLYASYITAHCRGRILKEIFDNGAVYDVCQISTDGIFTTKQFTKSKIGDGLGDLAEDKYKKAVIIGSGLYGLYDEKEKESFALRGLLVSKENFNKIYDSLKTKKTAHVQYKAFIGHKLSIAQHNKYGDKRLKFAEIDKTVNPFEYEKRLTKTKDIRIINQLYWYDIFTENEKNIESNKLKKLEFDLENEAIEDSQK